MSLRMACRLRYRLLLCIERKLRSTRTTVTILEEGYGFDAFDSSAADCVRTGHYQFSPTVALREAGFKRSSAAPDETAPHFPTRGG